MIPMQMTTLKYLSGIVILVVVFFSSSLGAADDFSRETPVVKAVRKVSPAVVNISSEQQVRQRSNPFSHYGNNPLIDNFFRDFFDRGFEPNYKRTSLGSGVIIDGKRGYVLTNAHVIANAGTVKVIFKDEREYQAQIVGADPDSDLAVLRITTQESIPAIEMGNSDDLMIGETVIAIGNPFGFSNTVTTGVISALNRSFRTEDRVFHDFIQIDASINPGNSGGPLLNINGELVGINTAIYAKAQGIGFAIPISKARRIITDLILHGEVIQAWLGLKVQDMDATLSQYLKLSEPDGPNARGVVVKEVEPSSPAAIAGIQAGDILLSIGTRTLASAADYQTAINDIPAGDTTSIRLWRNGKSLTLSITSAIFPEERAPALALKLLGIRVEKPAVKKQPARQSASFGGVVISEIFPSSHLARIGVKPGDIIHQMGDVEIGSVEDFNKAIVKYRQKTSVVILLQRADQLYNITVEL
ncbi:MAG: Do family serine endopeptidase [Deltaproteobacteria bacterium]|nr:Do family serine endopeptidase [Deltaproteobacteria bacterium]